MTSSYAGTTFIVPGTRYLVAGTEPVLWYHVDVPRSHADAYTGVAIPREVGRLFEIGHVVGGLEIRYKLTNPGKLIQVINTGSPI